MFIVVMRAQEKTTCQEQCWGRPSRPLATSTPGSGESNASSIVSSIATYRSDGCHWLILWKINLCPQLSIFTFTCNINFIVKYLCTFRDDLNNSAPVAGAATTSKGSASSPSSSPLQLFVKAKKKINEIYTEVREPRIILSILTIFFINVIWHAVDYRSTIMSHLHRGSWTQHPGKAPRPSQRAKTELRTFPER